MSSATTIYLQFAVNSRWNGGWTKVSRTPQDDFVPVDYSPEMEQDIERDDAGQEWLHVLDKDNNILRAKE